MYDPFITQKNVEGKGALYIRKGVCYIRWRKCVYNHKGDKNK